MHQERPAVTLEHVALAAGVSRATASRVLTGSGPASAVARRRVEETAARLGYVADPVARALVNGGGTRMVVAVVGSTSAILTDPYLARVVSTAAGVADGDGLGVSVQWLPLADPTPALDRLGRDRTVGGVVLVNTTRPLLDALPRSLHGRTVSIGVGGPAVPAVDVDNGQGARLVVEHLVRTGRRRIALVAGPPWLPCADRPVSAYRDALRTAGLPARVLTGDFGAHTGGVRAIEAVTRWPDTDAVFALGDAAALGALTALRRSGRGVPDDVAVAGYDDIPAAEHTALTTATHPVELISAAAARSALRPTGDGQTWFGSSLMVRQSA